VGGAPSKIWSFSSACKNLEAQHQLGAERWSSEKCTLGGYNSTSRSPRLLDQPSSDLFRLTREESLSNEKLTDFEYLHPFQRYSPPNFEVDRNWAKFCMFLAPKNFSGGSPKILDRDYKTECSSKHCAKFRADRPTELGDYARKKINSRKTLAIPKTIVSGRTTNINHIKIDSSNPSSVSCTQNKSQVQPKIKVEVWFIQSRRLEEQNIENIETKG